MDTPTHHVSLTLTTAELAHLQAALLTHCQALAGSQMDAPAWSALSKLLGVPDARLVMPTRLPTIEDAAAGLVRCELNLAMERTAKAVSR